MFRDFKKIGNYTKINDMVFSNDGKWFMTNASGYMIYYQEILG
jgi:hypothetical protein